MVFPLLVRGLGEVSVADLKDLFESCGTVRSCRIAGHGKAIIYFSDRDGQQRGHKLNGTDYEGSTVKTSLLKPSDAASTIKERDDAMSGEDTYSVVVNNVPPGTTHQEMEAAMEKHGEVSKVDPDKKSDTVWFVTYSDKTAARIASKKGARIGRALCKCVRVMPEGMKKAQGKDAGPEDGEEEDDDEDGEGGGGSKPAQDKGEHGKTLTVLVKKLPADATREDIDGVFGDCGSIKDVRIATPAAGKMCFIDFETKTGMRKACKLKKAEIRGTLLEIKHAKNVKDMSNWEQSTTPVPRNDPSHKPPDCRTVIVKNLPFDLGDTDDKIKNRIKRVFKACGSVQEVRLFMTYEEVPKFKGIAFVEFKEGDAAAAALKMNGRDNDGRVLKVDWVDNKDKALKRKAQMQKSKGINKKPNKGPSGKGGMGGKAGKPYGGKK